MAESENDVKLETCVKKQEKIRGVVPDRILRKRLPPRLPRSENHVYITNKTNYQAQLQQCESLLDRGEGWLVIHGLGAAVTRALNLALQLQLRNQGSVRLAVNTSTVALVDSLEPVEDQGDWQSQTRPQFLSACEGVAGGAVATAAAMFFTTRELVQWLGLTVFEMWVQLVAVTAFTVVLAVRPADTSWWVVFSPLFAGDALCAYFCTIVLIRMQLEEMYKAAVLRAAWSLSLLLLLFVFKFLLCRKLSGQSGLVFSEVMSPVFILLQLVLIRACQLH